tara:strand:+ start:288 stop:920 length:633 start_codon:yes stop_codon:yes gene_type:complete
MATNKRTYPNDNFAWYNDDDRLAILCEDNESVSGESVTERYDTFQGTGNLSGNLTASSDSAGAFVDFTSASHGLAVNDRVVISGTTSYDGNHAVTVVGDANTFRIAATNSTSNEGASSGVTFTSLFIDNGLRITYHSKYDTVSAQTHDLKTDAGLDSGLHPMLVCYLKARMFEDSGDLEKANYFRQMYEKGVHQYPLRKSGVRALAVPKL